MTIHIENFHFCQNCPAIEDVLKVVKRQELLIGKIMTTLNDLPAKLNEIIALQTEAQSEINVKIADMNTSLDALNANVAQLQEQLAQQGNPELPAETIALLDEVSLKAKALADIVPNPTEEAPVV
jgi:hypothetical protein